MSHTLSSIDTKSRTASCAECGTVRIKSKGVGRYECLNYFFEDTKPYLKYKGTTCKRCGFVAEHPVQMDVHHKDHNHQNNDESNLETLCANCHRLDLAGLL